MAKVLISTTVSRQWPGLSFITLTELHYTVLIQLYPGPLWVDHLMHKQHSLSTFKEQIHNQHINALCQPVTTETANSLHLRYYSTTQTPLQSITDMQTFQYYYYLIDTYKIHSSRSCEFDFGTLRDKTDVAYIKNKKLTIRKR